MVVVRGALVGTGYETELQSSRSEFLLERQCGRYWTEIQLELYTERVRDSTDLDKRKQFQ
jgi:hypothetical protein